MNIRRLARERKDDCPIRRASSPLHPVHPMSPGAEAAINEDVGAGDIGAVVGGEKGERSGDVLWGRLPTERYLGCNDAVKVEQLTRRALQIFGHARAG